jgi:hypothetical protein
MKIATAIRTSAILFAEEGMMSTKTQTTKRKFVEGIFCSNNNTELTVSELANAIEDNYGLVFTESEIFQIVEKFSDKYFLLATNKNVDHARVSLPRQRYELLCSREEQNDINQYIEQYIVECISDSQEITRNQIVELLHRYLYELLNSNINAYRYLLNPKSFGDYKVDPRNFTTDEASIINEFLRWDNDKKNIALFRLVGYSIEYAAVSNNSQDDVFLASLRKKDFYLDTNLIYRAIGINGKTRKQRTAVFLKKCIESGQKLTISRFTRQEFLDSIDHHINILKSRPFGKINPKIFNKCSGDTIYEFYHDWRKDRYTYGFDIFKGHILSLYDNLLKTYKIEEDYRVPYEISEYQSVVDKYAQEIYDVKRSGAVASHQYDASNLLWIEKKRSVNNINLIDTKYYFVTTDQKLKIWDELHSKNQPLTMLPSHWMALILKYVSRTSNDYKSFVSFLTIPKNESIIGDDELQVILSGISEITEDFERQESIMEQMVALKFTGIIDHNYNKMQGNARQYAKDKIEEQFTAQIIGQQAASEETLNRKNLEHKRDLEALEGRLHQEFEAMFTINQEEGLKDKRQSIQKAVRDMELRQRTADRKTKGLYTTYKFWMAFIVILYAILFIYIVHRLTIKQMEWWLWLLGILPPIGSVLWILIKDEQFSLSKILANLKNRIESRKYEEYQVSLEELKELKEMDFTLGQQLGKKTLP